MVLVLILSPGFLVISGVDEPFLSSNSKISDVKQFSDGKLIILTENNTEFKLIFRNGTIKTFSNFKNLTNDVPTQIFPLSDDLMIIMFCNIGTPCTNGTIIDLNGNVINKNVQLGGITTLTTNNMPDVGFLGVSYTNNTIRWIKFRFPQNNAESNLQINSGTIHAHANYSIKNVTLFNNIDGSHAIVYSSFLSSIHEDLVYISNPSYFTTSICFYNEDTKIVNDPIQIYDSLQNKVNQTTFICRSDFISNNSTSNICIIGLNYSPSSNITTNIAAITDLWLISFSSLGTVFQSKSFVYHALDRNASGGISPTIIPSDTQYDITPLPFGELLAINTGVNTSIQGPNNTLEHVAFYDVIYSNRSYGPGLPLKQTIDVAGYENPNIISTNPARNTLNSTVLVPFKITTFNISFSIQVIRSTGNISIYQSDNLRQIFPTNSKYCTTYNGSSTISGMILSCTILPSTFNRENQTYMITAENNFVKSASNNEPLIGIEKDIWMVSTSKRKSTTGTLRLTEDGTKYYKRLSSKKNFYEMLQNQLVDCIPLYDMNRLVSTNRATTDPNFHKQFLVEFLINQADSLTDPDVKTIITDLNTLIINKDASCLVKQNLSIFLDSTYGFQQSPNLWNEIKFYLLGLGAICLIFVAIYLWSRKNYPEGDTFSIFKVTLITLDFVLNVLFILTNGHEFDDLFISRETRDNFQFREWFTENSNILAVLTILSGADIESLTLFCSMFGGYKIFSAPFSINAINWINYGSILNIFIEDLPQLIIQ
ncbi:25780_t:CDS:2, partial [Gigaspora margarita]